MTSPGTKFSEADAINAASGFATCSTTSKTRVDNMKNGVATLLHEYEGQQAGALDEVAQQLVLDLNAMSQLWDDLSATMSNTSTGYTDTDRAIAKQLRAAVQNGVAQGGAIDSRLNP